MSIREQLEFTGEQGKDIGKELTLYALSTCGFCKSALRFLRKHKVAFQYLYIDQLEDSTKKMLKAELKETYGERPMYPFLVIDDKDHIVGFDDKEWTEKLGIEA